MSKSKMKGGGCQDNTAHSNWATIGKSATNFIEGAANNDSNGTVGDAVHNSTALLAPSFTKVTTLCADLVCRI